jgi:hypothetical protein
MADVITGLTDDDIKSGWLREKASSQTADDDAVDPGPGDAVDTDDPSDADQTDADDDTSDGDTDQSDS